MNTVKYVIKIGDRLEILAMKYGINMDELLAYNEGVTIDSISAGDILNVPIKITSVDKEPGGSLSSKLVSYPRETHNVSSNNAKLQGDINKFTAEVWENNKKDTVMNKKFEPYFSDNSRPNMKKVGFDIEIVYGGAVQNLIELNKYTKSKDESAFNEYKNNAIKAIRGVFIRSVGQELDASGNPVYEIYEFIGRDID